MQKVQWSLWCYSNLSPRVIQQSFDAQSLCILHSDCAKNLHMQTGGVWMAAWLEHAACQLQEVDWVFLAVMHKRFGCFWHFSGWLIDCRAVTEKKGDCVSSGRPLRCSRGAMSWGAGKFPSDLMWNPTSWPFTRTLSQLTSAFLNIFKENSPTPLLAQ